MPGSGKNILVRGTASTGPEMGTEIAVVQAQQGRQGAGRRLGEEWQAVHLGLVGREGSLCCI